jgi:hypothetical protein
MDTHPNPRATGANSCWTPDEDKTLKDAVPAQGHKDWETIASLVSVATDEIMYWPPKLISVSRITNRFACISTEQVKAATGLVRGMATVEWDASPTAGVIVDAVVALVMQAQSSAASIRFTSKPCRHPRDTDDEDEQAQKKATRGRRQLFHINPSTIHLLYSEKSV